MAPLPLPRPKPTWKPGYADPSFERWARGGAASTSVVRRRGAGGSQACGAPHPAPTRRRYTSSSLSSSTARGASVEDEEDSMQILVSRLRGLLFSSPGDNGSDDSWARKRKAEVDRSLTSNKEALRSPIEHTNVRKQRSYQAPRLPCIFLHGLFGFSTISPIASLPQFSFDYWRGIVERLQQGGVEVLVTNVKTSASIEERARDALEMIRERFEGREVNLIGHSMGGLDARYLTSCLLKEEDRPFTVRSVTTIATPHRGSPFASYLLYDVIGRERLPKLLSLVKGLGIPGGGEAFECLTTEEMREFNKRVRDQEGVRYSSWGAAFKPGLFNEFRFPHGIIWEQEGHNDGLVSVESSKWGEYRGTLKASHIELIGWGNAIQAWTSPEAPFDSQALYLTICEDLAKAGL